VWLAHKINLKMDNKYTNTAALLKLFSPLSQRGTYYLILFSSFDKAIQMPGGMSNTGTIVILLSKNQPNLL
jgi:hypothetical protein